MYGNKNCFVFLHIATVSTKVSYNFHISDIIYKKDSDLADRVNESTTGTEGVMNYCDELLLLSMWVCVLPP